MKFYKNIYTSKLDTDNEIYIESSNSCYTNNLNSPKLTEEEMESCEGLVTEYELNKVLKTFARNKTPGSDGLPFEIYLTFWDSIKRLLVDSFNYSFEHGKLGITQRQGILTLIPKKKRL